MAEICYNACTCQGLAAGLTPSADVPACRDEDPAWSASLAACYPDPPEYQHPDGDPPMTDLTTIILAKGSHDDNCDNPQRCFFEWYNWLTCQRHTDACPSGVSPVLHIFGMHLNDVLPDDRRQELKRFLPNGEDRLAGTTSDGKDETRGYIALDWLIRTYTPAFLDLSGLTAEAAALRDLRRIADLAVARSAGPVVREVNKQAAVAGDAARAVAGDVAWDAAWDAARDAAGDAAGAAAWNAARDAARAVAGDTAGAAAWNAARDAARAAAWDAARDVAWDTAGAAAWDAARAAARTKLTPTVTQLQDSAIALYDQMIRGTWDE